MDNGLIDSTKNHTDTSLKIANNITIDNGTNLTQKQKNIRKLSSAGIVIGSILVAFVIAIYFLFTLGCEGLSCLGPLAINIGILIFSGTILLISKAGLVTTSKSYLNRQEHSTINVAFGPFLTVVSSVFLIWFGYYIAMYASATNSWNIAELIVFTIMITLLLIGFAILSIGLNITLKDYPAEKRKSIIKLLLISTSAALLIYIVIFAQFL